MDIDILYPLVTEAIRRAEVLGELDAPGARSAHLDVSLLEERIASLLPASDDEGAIARRGAVRAAITAHEFDRAQELAVRFSEESSRNSSLRFDLEELKAVASAMVHRERRLDEKPRTVLRSWVDNSGGALTATAGRDASDAFIGHAMRESADLTTSTANRAAGVLIKAIVTELKKSGKFTMPSFGTFTVRKTKARKGLNPRTGGPIKVKAGKTVRFKASPTLKKSI